jgi:hypothetical protein
MKMFQKPQIKGLRGDYGMAGPQHPKVFSRFDG